MWYIFVSVHGEIIASTTSTEDIIAAKDEWDNDDWKECCRVAIEIHKL